LLDSLLQEITLLLNHKGKERKDGCIN